ncbi:hypothetical protein HN865_04495 [Candidatus Woesearchaeota archaeon]|nr:hypothetical protein [Candidatus Woesearchaeota archaeon]
MKKILKGGKIKLLLPEGEGGGLTGETHLVEYDHQKYVLRKCETLSKSRYYEHLSKKFEKYGFFPKFLGRLGKNVFFEYIEGRDLRSNEEKTEYLFEIGKILGIINKFSFENKFENLFNKQLKELTSGVYVPSLKVLMAREKRNIRKKPKKVLTDKQYKEILKCFKKLKKELNPKIVYECTDPMPGNFRVRKNKIYLVDIESIKPRYKGLGMNKFILEWGKTPLKKNKFIEGYNQHSSLSYFTDEYKKFIDLNFLIQRLNFQVQTGKDYIPTVEKVLRFIENE